MSLNLSMWTSAGIRGSKFKQNLSKQIFVTMVPIVYNLKQVMFLLSKNKNFKSSTKLKFFLYKWNTVFFWYAYETPTFITVALHLVTTFQVILTSVHFVHQTIWTLWIESLTLENAHLYIPALMHTCTSTNNLCKHKVTFNAVDLTAVHLVQVCVEAFICNKNYVSRSMARTRIVHACCILSRAKILQKASPIK